MATNWAMCNNNSDCPLLLCICLVLLGTNLLTTYCHFQLGKWILITQNDRIHCISSDAMSEHFMFYYYWRRYILKITVLKKTQNVLSDRCWYAEKYVPKHKFLEHIGIQHTLKWLEIKFIFKDSKILHTKHWGAGGGWGKNKRKKAFIQTSFLCQSYCVTSQL